MPVLDYGKFTPINTGLTRWFSLSILCDHGPVSSETKSGLDKDSRRERLIRTLVVDDTAPVLRAICSFLATQGNIEVLGTAQNGRQALEQAEVLRPELVLMDMHMPEMNGLEVTARLRKMLPATRVVMVTVHDYPEVRRTCKASGAHGFVSKNRLTEELPGEIHRVFSGP